MAQKQPNPLPPPGSRPAPPPAPPRSHVALLTQAEYDELIEALDQMTAWARYVIATGERDLVRQRHIARADILLAKHIQRPADAETYDHSRGGYPERRQC